MKKIHTLSLIICMMLSFTAISQPPLPPATPEMGEGNNTPIGSGAPVGDGLFMLLTLAITYTGRKVYLVKTTEII